MFVTLAILGVFFLAFMLYPGSSNYKSVYFFKKKTQIKPKSTNKTKISEQKTTKDNNFSRTETSKWRKSVYFASF